MYPNVTQRPIIRSLIPDLHDASEPIAIILYTQCNNLCRVAVSKPLPYAYFRKFDSDKIESLDVCNLDDTYLKSIYTTKRRYTTVILILLAPGRAQSLSPTCFLRFLLINFILLKVLADQKRLRRPIRSCLQLWTISKMTAYTLET